VRLRRGRFDDLVERQLDVFEEDEAALLTEAREADAAWTNADADDSEELYGDYQLVVDAIAESLHQIRETYAATLEGQTTADYRAAFDGAARHRFRRYSALLEETDD
jgi:hypothetical protein